MSLLIVLIAAVPLATYAQSLQTAIDRALRARSGAAIVLAVDSGKVLARYHPRVVGQRVVRPGSTIKPFVLLELLRSEKVKPATEWTCRRRVQVGRHTLDCQHVRTVEPMNAERALAYSCNSYFTEMGARLTSWEYTHAMFRWGFGAETRLVRTEASGEVRAPTGRGSLMLSAVGEDGVAATPIQMAAAYRKLALQAAAPDAAMAVVIAGMRGAVQYGTAQGAKIEGVGVAGKTGTSSAAEGPWTHAWFAGFAPADKPGIIVVIFLERGHGSEAAEIAGKVFKAWSERRQ